jgi:hypothetical protein
MVPYEFRGVVSAVGTDSITLSPVRGDGRRARMVLADAVSFEVTLDAKTRIRRGDMGRVTLDAVHVGDRVRVEIRAPKRTALTDLPAARRIQVRGPKVQRPEPAPSGEPAAAVDPAPIDPAAVTTPPGI